jgi:hypothetical protein
MQKRLLAPTLEYLNRLQDEMVTKRFRSDDSLFKLTQGAYSALFKLSVKARKLSRGEHSGTAAGRVWMPEHLEDFLSTNFRPSVKQNCRVR